MSNLILSPLIIACFDGVHLIRTCPIFLTKGILYPCADPWKKETYIRRGIDMSFPKHPIYFSITPLSVYISGNKIPQYLYSAFSVSVSVERNFISPLSASVNFHPYRNICVLPSGYMTFLGWKTSLCIP